MKFVKSNFLYLSFAFVALSVIGFELFSPTPSYHMFKFAQPVNLSGFGESEPVTFVGIGARVVGLWLFNYLLTAFLGFRLVSQLPYFRSQPRVLTAFSGFFLGYLGVTALSRVTSSIVPLPHDDFLTVILILSAAFLLRRPREAKIECLRAVALTLVVAAVVILGLALLQQIFFGDFRWVGHGHNQYAIFMNQWGREGFLFPIFNQHYDEFVFHHFLSGLFVPQNFNTLVPWWITLALNKASVFVFFAMVARAFGLTLIDAVLAAVFVFLGTLSLFPARYDLLFDSANPLLYVVHSGRLLGAPALLYIIWLWREQRVAWVAPFLVAAGLTATTISNTVWLVLVLLSLGLFSGMRSETARRRMESLWSLAICPLLYVFAAMVGLLWVKLGVLLAHLGWSTWIRGLPRALKSLRPMLWVPAFLGIAIFCLIFGNIAAGNFLGTWLREMMAVFSVPPDLISLAPEKAKAILDPLMGDHRETELYSLYSLSPYTFILLYGGFLILAALALRVRTSLGDAEDLVFAALTFALPFVFFFVEFVGVGDRAWVRTRFLEVPVCLIVFYSIVLLFKSGERRNWVRAYLLAFTIIPFIATERPLQIWENFKLLLSLG